MALLAQPRHRDWLGWEVHTRVEVSPAVTWLCVLSWTALPCTGPVEVGTWMLSSCCRTVGQTST